MNRAFLGSEPRLVGDAVLQLDQRQLIDRRELWFMRRATLSETANDHVSK